jgi:hypothetical protein
MVIESPSFEGDYYINNGRKIGDFFMGFFGMAGISFVLLILIAQLGFFLLVFGGFALDLFYVVIFAIALISFVFAVVMFFRRGRKYIAIGGIVCVIVIPLFVWWVDVWLTNQGI